MRPLTINEQSLVRVLAEMLVRHEVSPDKVLAAIKETTGDR